jgi:hypothetical protein
VTSFYLTCGTPKKNLFCPYSFSGSVEILNYSDHPSAPLLLDLSSNIGSLLVVRLTTKHLPEFEISIVSKDISGVVAGNSQINVYATYLS